MLVVGLMAQLFNRNYQNFQIKAHKIRNL